jgi:hypothetical protein
VVGLIKLAYNKHMLNKQALELKMQTRIITGTYGTSYYNETAEGAPRAKRETTGRAGRPAKAPAPVYSAMNDLFGRTPSVVASNTPGRLVVGRAGMKAVYANDEVEV